MRELYMSKVVSKTPCLIAKIRLGVFVHLRTVQTIPHARGRFILRLCSVMIFSRTSKPFAIFEGKEILA